MYTVIHTERAPKAIGPYSQAIAAKGFVFASGQIPVDPATGEIAGDTIEAQTEQVLRNLEAVLEAANATMDSIVKTTCFLSEMANFAAFNEVYARHIRNNPARACVAVRTLPKNVLVEVEAIAVTE